MDAIISHNNTHILNVQTGRTYWEDRRLGAELEHLGSPLTVAVLLVLVALVAAKFKISLLETTIILLPISVVTGSGGGALNLSAADPFLALLVVQAFMDKAYHEARREVFGAGSPLIKSLWLGSIMLVTMSFPVLALMGSSVRAYGVDALKVITVLLYMTAFAIIAREKIRVGNHRFLKIWSYVGAAVAVSGIFGSLLYERGIDTGLSFSYRATGTLNDPNSFATYMLLCVGITLLSAHKSQSRFPYLRLGLLVVALYFSYSRGGYIIFAGMLALSLLLLRGSMLMKKFVAIFVALPALYLALNPTVIEDVIFSKRDLSIEGDSRFDLWESALHIGSDQPFFGIGLGQFPIYADREFGAAFVTHNTFLSFFAEGGFVGLTLFVLLVGTGVFAALRILDRTTRSALIFSIVSVLAMATTLNLQNFRHVWAVIGVTFAFNIVSRSQPPIRDLQHDHAPESEEISDAPTRLSDEVR